jgi:serine/threonine-protein kinase
MSPEQIKCELLDGRSDVYSLGITWYEVVTGRVPFKGASIGELYRKHFAEMPALPSQYNPDVTDEFGKLVLKMLAKKRDDRPKSFHEVLMELKKVKVFKSDKEDEDMDGGGMM